MQVISLFSGIGGFELAAHWAGWQPVSMCEIDQHAQKVLRKNFPGVYLHDNIYTLTHEVIKENSTWQPEQPTIVVGGFPCQPFSVAGKRQGTDDDRYLWPEMLRIIQETRPQWVVAENVGGLVTMQGGVVLDEVLTSLEDEGYQVQPFIIPACAVGAWHRRDRIWIVAHATSKGLERSTRQSIQGGINGFTSMGHAGLTPHADGERCQEFNAAPVADRTEWHSRLDIGDARCAGWWEAESELRGVPNGISAGLDKGRAQRLKQLGNAIVPQVAYEIFKAINTINTYD